MRLALGTGVNGMCFEGGRIDDPLRPTRGAGGRHPLHRSQDLLLERGFGRRERNGEIDPPDESRNRAEIGGVKALRTAARSEAVQAHFPTLAMGHRKNDHPGGRPPEVDVEDVAGTGSIEGVPDRGAVDGTPGHRFGSRPQVAVLDDIAPFAGCRFHEFGEGSPSILESAIDPHEFGVHLELGEALRQQGVRLTRPVAADEVGGHVVGGSEGTGQPEGAATRERGDIGERHERRPQHDGIALGVDTPASRPAGELGELCRSEELVCLAGEFRELLDHHGSCRHVDAECERLGGEHDLDESLEEALFHRLLERWNESGMVGADTHLESERPVGVAEDGQVLIRERLHVMLDDLADPLLLAGSGEPEARAHAGSGGVVTAGPREDEMDCGEHRMLDQTLDRLDAVRSRLSPTPAAPGSTLGRPAAQIEFGPLRVRCSADEDREQMGVVSGAIGDEVPGVEGHRSPLLGDDLGRVPDDADPLGEFRCVRHGGRQTHESDVAWKVDDHLFPYRAPVRVLEVVNLVEYHPGEAVERSDPAVDHVPKHFGGHHHQRRITVDRSVTRQESHLICAVFAAQIVVLLVRERLDRCRVERAETFGAGPPQGVFGDESLARAGRGAHQHGESCVDGRDRLDLEAVEDESRIRFPAGRVVRQGGGSHSLADASTGDRRRSRRRRSASNSAPSPIDAK